MAANSKRGSSTTARALPAEITLHFSRERAHLVRAALLAIARLHDTPRQIAEQAKVIDAYVARELLRPAAKLPAAPAAQGSAATAVFGKIPPEFRTRGYTKNDELPAEFSDPEVVAVAREIDYANRRTKIETLEPEAADQLRLARRIVKHDRSRRQKAAPVPA
jgi:hypothetical protein